MFAFVDQIHEFSPRMTMSEPTSTAAATVSDFNQEAASLQETEAQLRQVIETFIELGIIVHDFQGTVEAKEGLVERV